MGSIGTRLTRYYKTTAEAARYHGMTKYGFDVAAAEPLKGLPKAGYFVLGLGYSLKEILYPIHDENYQFTQIKEAFAAVTSAQCGIPAPKEIRVTPIGTYELEGKSFSLITSDIGGDLPKKNKEMLSKIYGAMMGSAHRILSIDEIAMGTGYGVQTVIDALKIMVKEPQPGMERVLAIEDFVYFSGLEGEERRSEYQAAQQRHEKRFDVFNNIVGRKIIEIEGLPSSESIHDVFRIVNGDRDKLGIRFLDIFLCQKDDKLYLEQREALPKDFYRPDPQLPEIFMKSVIEGKKYSYSLIIGNDNKEAMNNVQNAGLAWDNDLRKFFDFLRERGIEDLIIFKALSAEKTPQAILVVSNPVFFGKENEERVITDLNRLSKAVGRTLGRIRGDNAVKKAAEESNETALAKTREDWIDRNEMAVSKFYDKATKIFSYICRLSRAYQTSVLEGIDHVFEDIKRNMAEKGAINVIDAGVGSAYFLEKLMQEAEEKKINIQATAIDLSKVACTIARKVCEKFGNLVQVSKGNITKMTKYLENIDPIKPGTQDIFFLNYVLQYAPIEEVLKEVNRVLKIGGRVLITNFKPKKSMRWNEFWTNVSASWVAGREKKFGHGRAYELARYFLLFFRHPFGIVKFAMDIDRDIRKGIIPENPDKGDLAKLLEKCGFNLIDPPEDTHHQAAIRVYAEKIKDL